MDSIQWISLRRHRGFSQWNISRQSDYFLAFYCAEILLRVEPKCVQNVAILCQNGQFGTTLLWTLQMEDKENPFLSSLGAKPRANLWTGSDLRNVFTNPFGLRKMVSGRICYICDAVFAKRKYSVDINCLRLQYFSSQSRLYCILKQRRNHIHSKQIWTNLLFRVLVPLVGQISLLHIFLVG